LREDSEI